MSLTINPDVTRISLGNLTMVIAELIGDSAYPNTGGVSGYPIQSTQGGQVTYEPIGLQTVLHAWQTDGNGSGTQLNGYIVQWSNPAYGGDGNIHFYGIPAIASTPSTAGALQEVANGVNVSTWTVAMVFIGW